MEKDGLPSKSNENINFWLCAGLIVLILASVLSRDIDRPFYGLHSWDHAHYAWMARNHLTYGLKYTKGMDTLAVGNPPPKNPQRYVDHPQLYTLCYAAAMAVFGINSWSVRLGNMLATIAALLIFLKILRGLLEDKTALFAGLLFSLFPLTGYFGAYGMWIYPVVFLAFWCYLVIIGGLKNGPQPRKIHFWILAISLFLALQLGWEGFFYALAIGVHYVFRCIGQRRMPDVPLLAILIIAPLSSLMLDFIVMAAAGDTWDFQRIMELYKWRAGSGEMPRHDWGLWLAKIWEHSITNFTLPVLVVAILYLTLGQLLTLSSKNAKIFKRFPQFWLFLMPAIFQLFLIKGAVWQHQTWLRPLAPFIAIAVALGLVIAAEIFKKLYPSLEVIITIALTVIIFISCAIGTNYYYAIRWQCPEKIEMFENLRKKIPPDKALLSFEPFIVDQHKAKKASYRPEIAWCLDREIVVAGKVENGKLLVEESVKQIRDMAKTGKYPYYLIPITSDIIPLAKRLAGIYKFEQIEGHDGEYTREGKFLKAGMLPYMIFDLSSESNRE